jgi:hypothetical protein
MKKIGKTRIKLAELLRKEISGFAIEPEDLKVSPPEYLRPTYDIVKWYGMGKMGEFDRMIGSYSSMAICLKCGIDVTLSELPFGDIIVMPK